MKIDGKKHTNAAGMGAGIAIGMGIGIAIGVGMHNIGAGIAIGVAIGIALGASMEKKRKRDGADGGVGRYRDDPPGRTS